PEPRTKKPRPPPLPRRWYLQVTYATSDGSATAPSRTWTKERYALNNARRYQSRGCKVVVLRGLPT
ncbi:MAG: hypothetical protein M3Q39_16790, partial [Actinomycetota bacterium]|nr:hypothetical protein [Actinomycetota bacterium]